MRVKNIVITEINILMMTIVEINESRVVIHKQTCMGLLY